MTPSGPQADPECVYEYVCAWGPEKFQRLPGTNKVYVQFWSHAMFLSLYCSSVNHLEGFTVELRSTNNKREITFCCTFAFHRCHFHSFPRPHFTELLCYNNNYSNSSTSTGRNICIALIWSFFPKNMLSFQIINAFMSQFLQWRALLHTFISSSPPPAEDTEGGMIENVCHHVTQRENISHLELLEVGCRSFSCNNTVLISTTFNSFFFFCWGFDLRLDFNFSTEYNYCHVWWII